MAEPPRTTPPVVLFGYASSPFTNKVRLVLRLKGVEYTYIPVPSMLPRPLLTQTFSLTYRKIPILSLGREIYCDTSLIIEALEHFFPPSAGYASIYPSTTPSWPYRGIARGLTSYWFDRPLFRTTTGLIPARVWKTDFGADRAGLIGHGLDAEKLGRKIPQNLAGLDMHLSFFEDGLRGREGWIFPTDAPSLVDVGLWYQVKWGWDIGAGRGVYDLSGGRTDDKDDDDDVVVSRVFSKERYPGVWDWFHRFEEYVDGLRDVESVVNREEDGRWKVALSECEFLKVEEVLVPTASEPNWELDGQRGLRRGVRVSVAPDDTGRDCPTLGVLVALGVEEVVIRPIEKGEVDVRIHFPRLGFVVKVLDGSVL